ncbi:MAG: hypothetical protein ABR552_02310 [Actinomycetota bacterium]
MAERIDREPLSLSEQDALARAVRASVHDQIIDLLERRGLISREDLITCPRCGDQIILLDQPATFTLDHGDKICAACAAERDFIRMVRPEDEIGGEGA